MSASDSVTACVEVAVDPTTASAVFTDEIGRWWRPGPINRYDSARAIDIRFESGVGGRWLEIYDDAGADVLEIGRITGWAPGDLLVVRLHVDERSDRAANIGVRNHDYERAYADDCSACTLAFHCVCHSI